VKKVAGLATRVGAALGGGEIRKLITFNERHSYEELRSQNAAIDGSPSTNLCKINGLHQEKPKI
jgi:hypothetical protein